MIEDNSVMDFSVYRERRERLLEKIDHAYRQKEGGIVILFANFEEESVRFRQESSFYYFTGLEEPGTVLVMDRRGKSTLYIPNCGQVRNKWVKSPVQLSPDMVSTLCIDEIAVLGDECSGYQLYPFSEQAIFNYLITVLKAHSDVQHPIFTLCPSTAHSYIQQRFLLMRLASLVPGLERSLVDISPLVASMRRKKSKEEIADLFKAVEITMTAQATVAQIITDGMRECEAQAGLEAVITMAGARCSFPSIVAAGANSTVLHYVNNDALLHNGDVVVVDIGAEYKHYCGDITRTYPVSKTFTKRQRELYNVVLDTQDYIANIARPGYWLSNKEDPKKSLHHLAVEFLKKRNLHQFFIHGIGHYLGLDVHDVGDYATPLQSGDVITIEPGVYLRDEKLGIRIEDNYWIVDDGAVCLSEDLPKSADDIELLMQEEGSAVLE